MRRVGLGCVVAIVVVAILGAAEAIAAGKNAGPDRLGRIDRIVVYQENHHWLPRAPIQPPVRRFRARLGTGRP